MATNTWSSFYTGMNNHIDFLTYDSLANIVYFLSGTYIYSYQPSANPSSSSFYTSFNIYAFFIFNDGSPTRYLVVNDGFGCYKLPFTTSTLPTSWTMLGPSSGCSTQGSSSTAAYSRASGIGWLLCSPGTIFEVPFF